MNLATYLLKGKVDLFSFMGVHKPTKLIIYKLIEVIDMKRNTNQHTTQHQITQNLLIYIIHQTSHVPYKHFNSNVIIIITMNTYQILSIQQWKNISFLFTIKGLQRTQWHIYSLSNKFKAKFKLNNLFRIDLILNKIRNNFYSWVGIPSHF